MNILEQENIIKGAPDEVLLQEAQAPSGQLPQFLVVSEIQRRKEMRNRFAAQETQPEQTVSEQIVAEASAPQGIAGLPAQIPLMPDQAMPSEMMATTGAPVDPQMGMMSGGGIVEMQEGRQVPRSEGLQRAIMEVLTGKYTPEDKLINELVKRSGIPVLRDVHSKQGTLRLNRPNIFGKNSEMALRYNPRHKSGGVQFIKRFQDGGLTTQGDEIEPNNGADGISTNPYQAFIDAQQDKYDSLKEYITETLRKDEERQRKSMMSDALINIGAGIASGNIGAGLEKAGASVAATRKAQRDREQAVQLQLMKEMPGGAGSYTDLPSSVREYQFFIGLSPDEQARYLNLKRQTQKIVDINGVPTIVTLVGGTYFDQNNNPVTPDANTVVRELPSTEGGVSQATEIPPTDVSPTVVPEVSAVIAPSGVQTVPLSTQESELQAAEAEQAAVTAGGAGGLNLTPAQQKVDEDFAPEYVEWAAGGGFATINKNLEQLDFTLKALESGDIDVTGGYSVELPNFLRSRYYPESMDVQEQVEEVVQRNLRLVLGAQFTEREGERLIARAYNKRMSEERNARRVRALLESIRVAADAKNKAALYYQEHGTLAGFDGISMPTIEVIDSLYTERLQASPDEASSDEASSEQASPEKVEELQMLNDLIDAERQK
jgi:hypothetical protein